MTITSSVAFRSATLRARAVYAMFVPVPRMRPALQSLSLYLQAGVRGGWGLGVGGWGLGFGVWGLGFGVWGLGFEEVPAGHECADRVVCEGSDGDVHVAQLERALQQQHNVFAFDAGGAEAFGPSERGWE